MPDYNWPPENDRVFIGKRITRVDAPFKVSGRAKYTYDANSQGRLYGKILRSPYAHAKIVSIDVSAAEKMPGVKAVHIIQGPGTTIFWAGDEVVGIAATSESIAEDAARAIKVVYQKMEFLVLDNEPPQGAGEGQGPLSAEDIDDLLDNQVPNSQIAGQVKEYGLTEKFDEDTLKELKADGANDEILNAIRAAAVHPEAANKPHSNYKRATATTKGDPDQTFKTAEMISRGMYGSSVIAHCCLESHGSMSQWTDPNHLFVRISTQNVSGIAGQMSEQIKLPA